MLTRRLSKVCATLSLFLLCSAGLASAAEASSAGSARHASPRIIDVARDASFGSSGTAVASAAPLSASETFRALLQPLSTGKIIRVTNNSFFDGSTGGGGVIFLAGNVIKTDRRAAHLAIAVTAVRKSGGKVVPLAEKSDDCPKATSCQVTSVERGHGNNYRVPGNFTGEIDAVAKGTWYRRGKAPLVDSATKAYNFQDGLLQP